MQYLHRSRTRVATANGQVSGFFSLLLPKHPASGDAELHFMFVRDRWRGHGVGRVLFNMRGLGRELGVAGVRIVSHPPAESFCHEIGVDRVGTQPPAGRVTWSRPVLRVRLAEDEASAGTDRVCNSGDGDDGHVTPGGRIRAGVRD